MKTFTISLALFVVGVHGHGRLMDPPARNSMWRFGYPNPVNYNDNEIWCGGYGKQHGENGGKCGVCGDNYADKQPRAHEAGGEFAQGIIGKEYIVGEMIDVEIDLSANHWGHFELKLCPVDSPKQPATQACMDKHPLYLESDPKSYKFFIPKETPKKDVIRYRVKLPEGITCRQCVIQWTYHTGNTWGDCNNGTSAVGCGDQETFRNCADVMIRTNTGGGFPPGADITKPNAIYFRDQSAPNGRRPLVVRSQVCVPKPLYVDTPDLAQWCQQNCLKYPPACNRSMCKCLGECRAVGELEGVEGADVWCHRQCLSYPSNCPADKCECTEEEPESAEPSQNLDEESNVEVVDE